MDPKAEAREFLTAARGRLSPEQAGVPMFGGERRVPGLRREEVAQLAGVSLSYYTRMERGDLAGVSEIVLRSTAAALQLDPAETAHLLDLGRNAGGSGRRSPRRRETRLSPEVAHLVEAMRDVPVIVGNRLGDVLASNRLGRALFPDLFPPGAEPLNQFRYTFFDPRARDFYADWETTARGVVSSMRLAAGHDPGDRPLMTMIGELVTHSPEFRAWWSGHTVRAHVTGRKDIRHPVVGEMTLVYTVLTLDTAPGVAITSYLTEPAGPSADALDLLRSWAAEPLPDDSTTQAGETL
ncbi:helix-turn-helix transcriptional regulator [Cnuibacter physcomitrellae]|uniref:helix-turn-helix transcriptional regulator n=1 Tax=Cnuibacter physcomitrellae TaxID=1619308 RepID=UPI0021760950|nr:helix-turn-helix transcriptional regulator [Cnuibacter physcomitrellae]MCS5498373.1 helix-turn-helix transcriptional regulator [Cnuibacter physcomitrellae]